MFLGVHFIPNAESVQKFVECGDKEYQTDLNEVKYKIFKDVTFANMKNSANLKNILETSKLIIDDAKNNLTVENFAYKVGEWFERLLSTIPSAVKLFGKILIGLSVFFTLKKLFTRFFVGFAFGSY